MKALKHCAASLLTSSALALASHALAATSGDNGVHDPSRMIESDGKVYLYATGGGAKSSPDGLVWKNEPTPAWNRNLLPDNQGIWAPDGLFLNGQYLLYGALWSADKSSALVLLTSPTLDPSSPKYKWTDRGVAIAGPAGVTHSCIDPAPVLDAHGDLWVVWGGGYPFSTSADSIFVTRMNNDTGLPLTSDPGYKPPASPGYAIAEGHKEGPYLYYHSGYYYLFYQTGSCCDGASSTYTMHVARSSTITGGYTGDRTFYASTGNVHGPGHIGIYSACGYERFTYHYYPSNNSIIGENELEWSRDGWPQVGAESTTPMKLCASNEGGAGGGGSGSGAAGMSSTPAAGGAGTGGGGSAAVGGTAGGGASEIAGSPSGGESDPSGGRDAGNNGEAGSSNGATLDKSGGAGTSASGTTSESSHESTSARGCACRIERRAPAENVLGLLGAFGALLAFRRRRARRLELEDIRQ